MCEIDLEEMVKSILFQNFKKPEKEKQKSNEVKK